METEKNEKDRYLLQLEIHSMFLSSFISMNKYFLEDIEIKCIEKTKNLLDQVRNYLERL